MCGRVSLFTPAAALEERFGAEAAAALPPRYNIAPGDELAAIRSPDRIEPLEWGLIPAWMDGPGDGGFINARAETVREKPSFRSAFERRRCLVLADGYYDWVEHPGGKRPYRFALPDDEPFAMAGLWERWEGEETRETAAVVTTGPNRTVEPIHHRMPVILDPGEEAAWLDADPAEAADLLDPYGGEMRAYPVSTDVNDPSNDGPELIEEAGRDQTGLDEFA